MTSRHFLSKKESRDIIRKVNESIGCDLEEKEKVEVARLEGVDVYLIKGEPLIFKSEEEYFLTLRGLLKIKPQKRWIHIDKGAIKAVSNGADLMVPGITAVDEDIKKNQQVWISDTEHRVPIAVGKALLDGKEMLEVGKGKAVKVLFYVGDKFWRMTGDI